MASQECEQVISDDKPAQSDPAAWPSPTLPDLEANSTHFSALSRSCGTRQNQSSLSPNKAIPQPRQWPWSRWKMRPNARIVSDAILGLSDGLTVPFALTAGLAALGDTKIVVLGGLAELIAGAISMGLGGFVGAKSEMESFHATERSCNKLMLHEPEVARDCVQKYFDDLGLLGEDTRRIADHMAESGSTFKTFLMQNHFRAAKPDSTRPYFSALTLGISYFTGGFVPLLPYFVVARHDVMTGLWWSIGLMAFVLLIFGYVKTGVVRGWSGRDNYKACIGGALQMLVVGALAAGAAVGLVRLINGHGE